MVTQQATPSWTDCTCMWMMVASFVPVHDVEMQLLHMISLCVRTGLGLVWGTMYSGLNLHCTSPGSIWISVHTPFKRVTIYIYTCMYNKLHTYVTWVNLCLAKAGRCETWTVLPCTALEVKDLHLPRKGLLLRLERQTFLLDWWRFLSTWQHPVSGSAMSASHNHWCRQRARVAMRESRLPGQLHLKFTYILISLINY